MDATLYANGDIAGSFGLLASKLCQISARLRTRSRLTVWGWEGHFR